MKLDKSQMPQIIILGVLLLLCIGYVGLQVTKPKPAPPKPAAAEQTQTQSSEVVEPEDAASAELNAIQAMNLPPVKQRDPFAPQMTASLPSGFTRPAVNQYAPRDTYRPISTPKHPVPKFGALPGLGTSSFTIEPVKPTVGGPDSEVNVGQTQPASSTPEFKVTGIIRGESNVAIVRIADERHIVREGQWINGIYKVTAITEDGVVLVGKDRRISLKLGGERNAI